MFQKCLCLCLVVIIADMMVLQAAAATADPAGITGKIQLVGATDVSGKTNTNRTTSIAGKTLSSGTTDTSDKTGTSGTTGIAGKTQLARTTDASGDTGTNGSTDTSGNTGTNGTSDTTGNAGATGTTGTSGEAGTTGTSETGGTDEKADTSGAAVQSGTDAVAGAAGTDSQAGASQTSAESSAASVTSSASGASSSAALESGSSKNSKNKKTTRKSSKSKKKDLSVLKKNLKKKLASYGGTWSVYVKDLKTDKSIIINDRKMYAASLIKLYAMGAALEQVKKGKMSSSSISGLLNSMITVSDNASFNEIVSRVGKKTVNRWIKSNKFKKTKVVHDVGLAANSTIVRDGRTGNTTSAADCGKFLEMVYRGKCVSARASKVMLGYLKKQTRRGKIPAGIPSGVIVANKTGETDETCHDAAIVYAKKNPYILVVMVTSPGNAWTKDSEIASVSKLVYDFFKK